MPYERRAVGILIFSVIISATPSYGTVKMRLIDGRPVADGVYVDGHGPFRFLLDTGANTNLIARGLARRIGMKATFKTGLASVSSESVDIGSAGNEISVDTVRAAGQEFLLTDIQAFQGGSSDIQGLLGQAFLSQFEAALVGGCS